MNINKYLRNVGIPLIIIFLLPILFYVSNFRCSAISDLPTDWGIFGSFIGGVTGPLIAIANVLVLVFLTFKISDIDKNNKETEIENRKNENLDAMMLIGFKELNAFFIELIKVLASNDDVKEEVKIELKFKFHGIIHPYIDLFKTFDNLNKINRLGNMLLKIQSRRNEDERFEIMNEFSELLSDLRLEIKSITATNKQ